LLRPLARSAAYLVATVLGGIIVLHLAGILWLAAVSHISVTTAIAGTMAFMPGDLIKAVLAVLVVQRVEALFARFARQGLTSLLSWERRGLAIAIRNRCGPRVCSSQFGRGILSPKRKV
jgi:hypothetical protein